MGVLSDLEPGKVFHYFEEICAIPHGSGNLDRISDYLVNFAKERGLSWRRDEAKNVIIVKEATPGYEDEPALILQGHMDMVAVKEAGCDIDMKEEGLRLAVDGDNIYAQGTSLGGDDGIAVAYALAILDSDDISHPELEVVITTDEELGMDGATALDMTDLKANRLLNMDSEEEGIFLTSCAGGARVDLSIPVHPLPKEGIVYRIEVGGLAGGHSGSEIQKERGNSNALMGRLLYTLAQKIDIGICSLEGGEADNAIPRQTTAKILINESDGFVMAELLDTETARIREELSKRDPEFKVNISECGKGTFSCVTGREAYRCAACLMALPCGVQAMSQDIPGLVETSLNIGILRLNETEMSVVISVRSSVESSKHALINKLGSIASLAGGSVNVKGEYPGWKYRADSPLRDKMIAVYKELYGKEPRVEAIHAGLECGILGSKMDDPDCVSIGPDMSCIHTTDETLSISSVGRVWEFLVRLLARKDDAE